MWVFEKEMQNLLFLRLLKSQEARNFEDIFIEYLLQLNYFLKYFCFMSWMYEHINKQ